MLSVLFVSSQKYVLVNSWSSDIATYVLLLCLYPGHDLTLRIVTTLRAWTFCNAF